MNTRRRAYGSRRSLVGAIVVAAACGGPDQQPEATLGLWQLENEIGVLDGAKEYVFGGVRAAVLRGDSEAVVLDGIQKNVRVVSISGRSAPPFGREGSGPGEFLNPIDIVERGGDTVVVVDRGSRRITTVVVGRSSSVVETRSLPLSPNDACMAGDRLVLLGNYNGKAIHVFDVGQTHLSSLAPLPPADSTDGLAEMYRHEWSEGYLECLRDGYVQITERTGEIARHDSSGRLVWKRRLNDFVQPQRTIRPHGVRFDIPEEADHVDRVAATTLLDAATLFVTIQRTFRRELNREDTFIGLHVDAVSGAVLSRNPNAPQAITAKGDRMVARGSQLIPTVQLWRRK